MDSKKIRNPFKLHIINSKGVTLVELLLAVTLLAIISLPFLGSFLSATGNNQLSKDILSASTLAQKAMEEIKANPALLKSDVGNGQKLYPHGGTEVIKYNITLETTGSLPDAGLGPNLNFTDIQNIVFDIEYLVHENSIELKSSEGPAVTSYALEDKEYTLSISGSSSPYRYDFLDTLLLKSGELSKNVVNDPIRVKIQFDQMRSSGAASFVLHSNSDNLNERQVEYYILDRSVPESLVLDNTGSKPFYCFDSLTSSPKNYNNVIYKIEVVVEKNNEVLSKLVSYVNR